MIAHAVLLCFAAVLVHAQYEEGHYIPQQLQPYEQQQPLRTHPRLLVSPKEGRPLLRAVKKVRISQQSPYAVDEPVTFSQTVPAVATYRPQSHASAAQTLSHAIAPQPTYYIQRPTPIHHHHVSPKPILRSVRPHVQQEQEPEEEYPSDPNPQYNFSFDVKDDELTNYQNRQEEREGGVIKGSYSVVDPDGYVRTVTYTADSKNGFQAKVVREPTDVKVKVPPPSLAETQHQNPHSHPAKLGHHVPRAQLAAFPQYQQVYAAAPANQAYSHQAPEPSHYAAQQPQPSYVLRRVPASHLNPNSPHQTHRLVKVLRAQ